MRAHVIEGDKIVNTIEVESLDFAGLELVDADIGGQIGDSFVNGAVVPAAPPAPPVPDEVSRRAGLAAIFLKYGMTKDQLVIKIQQVITDPTQQYLVLNEVTESQVFQRQRPIVIQMAAVLEWDLDALFSLAATLT